MGVNHPDWSLRELSWLGNLKTSIERTDRVKNLGPVTLEGRWVRLEPMRDQHFDGLLEAAQSSDIWHWMSRDLSDPANLAHWIDQALSSETAGEAYAFTVIDARTGRIVGSSRYLDIHSHDRGVEIGWTWYRPEVWGTTINPEAKWLLLQHAFTHWGALRVAFRTDHLNVRSQSAIRKLGAVYEGTLRNHRIRKDGSIRHTVSFSIISEEWAEISRGLLQRIEG